MDIFKSKGLQPLVYYLTVAIFFAVVQIQLVDAAMLNSCTYPGSVGDLSIVPFTSRIIPA